MIVSLADFETKKAHGYRKSLVDHQKVNSPIKTCNLFSGLLVMNSLFPSFQKEKVDKDCTKGKFRVEKSHTPFRFLNLNDTWFS